MAAMAPLAHRVINETILIPPDGLVKLKDKRIPVIDQVILV